jgi:hypothetical protein
MPSSMLKLRCLIALVVMLAATTGCGCDGVGLGRVTPTEQTIAVGESVTLAFEAGGGCVVGSGLTNVEFRASPTVWRTADTAVIALDTLTGRVTGRHSGDAQVFPRGIGSAVIHVR